LCPPKSAGALAPVLIDRLWADTLTSLESQRIGTRIEMLTRTQMLFVLTADRATWSTVKPRG
jgi:hypothetical protein